MRIAASPVTPDLFVSVAEKLNDLPRSNILGSASDIPDCAILFIRCP